MGAQSVISRADVTRALRCPDRALKLASGCRKATDPRMRASAHKSQRAQSSWRTSFGWIVVPTIVCFDLTGKNGQDIMESVEIPGT